MKIFIFAKTNEQLIFRFVKLNVRNYHWSDINNNILYCTQRVDINNNV